jgi:hypothetical protein
MSDKPFVASEKPFVAEACPPMSHASASNGLSDIETHMKNAPCNRPLNVGTVLKCCDVIPQDLMADRGRTIVMHAEELRRLNKKLEVIEQIHTAPAIYIAAAVEVVRRRAFRDDNLRLQLLGSSSFNQAQFNC